MQTLSREQRSAFILMQRIFPKKELSVLVRGGSSGVGLAVHELGVYSSLLVSEKKGEHLFAFVIAFLLNMLRYKCGVTAREHCILRARCTVSVVLCCPQKSSSTRLLGIWSAQRWMG
jgi:hypothetical protein